METIKNLKDIEEFKKKFYSLHGCDYIKIAHDYKNNRITLILKILWKDSINIYDKNELIILTFNHVIAFNINDNNNRKFISNIYLNIDTSDKNSYVIFSDNFDENNFENSNINITCDNISYEIKKDQNLFDK